MKLRTVTITGADDRTSEHDLERLSRIYPFVEWGLLLSDQRTGAEPRYPALRELRRMAMTQTRKSVHLCGNLARCAAEGRGFPIETALQLVEGAKRVQINLGRSIDRYPDIYNYIRFDWRQRLDIIIQAYSFDIAAIEPAVSGSDSVVFLHDASGGRGISGAFQTPPNRRFVGYAGGIWLENLEDKIEAILSMDAPNDFWIDIETGARTDDWFDIDKCEQILSIAQKYIEVPCPST